MKRQTNILLIVLLVFSGLLSAQKPVKDTLGYLKRFETNKEKYIGKPFSLLLKDMTQLQPAKAKSDIRPEEENTLPSTLFTFSGKDVTARPNAVRIITWKPDDSQTAPLELLEQEHNYRFTASERNFLEKKIVKNMMVSQ